MCKYVSYGVLKMLFLFPCCSECPCMLCSVPEVKFHELATLPALPAAQLVGSHRGNKATASFLLCSCRVNGSRCTARWLDTLEVGLLQMLSDVPCLGKGQPQATVQMGCTSAWTPWSDLLAVKYLSALGLTKSVRDAN